MTKYDLKFGDLTSLQIATKVNERKYKVFRSEEIQDLVLAFLETLPKTDDNL